MKLNKNKNKIHFLVKLNGKKQQTSNYQINPNYI